MEGDNGGSTLAGRSPLALVPQSTLAIVAGLRASTKSKLSMSCASTASKLSILTTEGNDGGSTFAGQLPAALVPWSTLAIVAGSHASTKSKLSMSRAPTASKLSKFATEGDNCGSTFAGHWCHRKEGATPLVSRSCYGPTS